MKRAALPINCVKSPKCGGDKVNAVYILWLRELKRYTRSRAQIVASLGQPLLYLLQFGFLKETLVAPVPRLTVMVGKTLGGATVATIQGLLVLIICLVAGFRPVN